MNALQIYSDIELFERFKDGDQTAFEQIYKRYWSCLLNEAYRLTGTAAESKDLVQDIFMSLYQKAGKIDIKFSFKAYLYQTLRYKVINSKRDRLIHQHCHQDIYHRRSRENDFPNQLETKELNKHLHVAIDALPKKCKQVFLLSREADYSHKAISKALQISTSTVEKHIVKALKILRLKINYQEMLA